MKAFSKKTLVLLCAIVLIASATATVLAVTYLTVPSTGHIHVPVAAGLAVTAGNLAWGTFNTGATQTKTLTLTNNGDSATTALSMSTSTLPAGVSLSWDGNGKTVAAHSTLDVTFTLTSSVSADVDLSFNVIISGV